MASTLTDADVAADRASSRASTLTPDEVAAVHAAARPTSSPTPTRSSDVDTTGVPPTSHPLAADRRWREDEPRPSLDRDRALAERAGRVARAGLFKVPKVL